jgi:3-methyladenine DNA glycosylase AlkD
MDDALSKVITELREHADPNKAEFLSNWFKNRPGEMPDDDFLGIKVPVMRAIAKKYFRQISLTNTEKLLASKWHEERLTALFILNNKYSKYTINHQAIFDLYIANLKYVNNWDLVDSSAPYIVGEHLKDNQYRKKVLSKMAESSSVWERRVAVLAAGQMLKYGDSEDTYMLAIKLLEDKDDYIHKAVGWMLREAGKRVSRDELLAFLDKYGPLMPRTTLRYAIEHLDKSDKKHYLALK